MPPSGELPQHCPFPEHTSGGPRLRSQLDAANMHLSSRRQEAPTAGSSGFPADGGVVRLRDRERNQVPLGIAWSDGTQSMFGFRTVKLNSPNWFEMSTSRFLNCAARFTR